MSTESDCGCGGSASSNQPELKVYGWMPDGCTVNSNLDDSITITPPAGWIYVGTTDTN